MTDPDDAARLVRGWFPQSRDPSPQQRRKHALAAQVRTLLEQVLYLDAEASEDAELVGLQAALETASTALDRLPDLNASGGLWASPADESLFERSPFSGQANALAAPLVVWQDGERTRAHATYGLAYEGPPGSVHGGHVMGAFDDVLGVAQAASGTAGFTGTLTVRMVARTPLHQRIDYEAGVQAREGRKVTVWGEARHGDTLLAQATGIFIAPRGPGWPPQPDAQPAPG